MDPRGMFEGDRFGGVTEITPLTQGLSGAEVWAVTTTKGAYVLRVDRPENAAWETQVGLQSLAAQHGIAPQIELIDRDRRAVVTRRIEGAPFARVASQPATRPAALASLAAQLSRLHAIALPAGAARDPVAMAKSFWRQKARRGFPAWALPLEATVAEVEAALARDPRRVFAHGDPNPANMLWDGTRVWLVDWEKAGGAHPFFDAAVAANFLALSPADGEAFLVAQEGGPLDGTSFATLRLFRRFAYGVYGLAFFGLIPDLDVAAVPGFIDAPSLTDVYARMASGQLVLRAPEAQAQFGAAMLRQGLTL
jgi:Ser/Thr protein kinase RdoA (MazF antagonist)